MAAEMVRRDVAAPAKDWLVKKEVCDMIDVSDSTLDRMIDAGQFPRAVPFPGEKRARWRWVDIAWYLLGREVAERLSAPAPDAPDPGEGAPGARRGPPGPK